MGSWEGPSSSDPGRGSMAPESHSAAVQLLTTIFALGTISWKHNLEAWDHSGPPEERFIPACVLRGAELLWSKIDYPTLSKLGLKL